MRGRNFRSVAGAPIIMISKAAFLLVGILVFARTAEADPFLLSDQNSTFEVNPDSNQGAFSWEVDGTEHLFREWFWYRALFMSRERSIDRTSSNAAAPYVAAASDSGDSTDTADDKLVITYTHAAQQFKIEVEYDLDGSPTGTGVSTLTETIRVTNTRTTGNLTFNLFEYSDFNVNGTAGDDTATRLDASTIEQTDPSSGSATVTVVQPQPDHYQIAPVPTIFNSLENSSVTNLNDTTTNVSGGADMAFAFQWTEIIAPGSTWVITKEKAIEGLMAPIPEPGSLLLVGSGLLAMREWRKRRASVRVFLDTGN